MTASARRGVNLSWPTKLLGLAAIGTAATLLTVELARIWRLGSLPEQRDEAKATRLSQRARRTLRIAREGYAVSRARRNAVFNMLVSFMVTLGLIRAITRVIREKGGAGILRNVHVGERHIHHFVPGMVICFLSGGVALGSRSENPNLRGLLAIPFGAGVALVLDETALLLELEDVYWSEEGVLSLQVAFGSMALLAAVAYWIGFLRAATARLLESDWEAAARAWEDVSRLSGDM
jgi:hypothetical protein